MELQDPGEVYRGSRFDWTGQIINITLKDKHYFCTSETKNPVDLDSKGRGFYNEFGIDQPIGYDECRLGEKFHKPGVGLLIKKDNYPYSFSQKYDILPLNVTIDLFPKKIVYTTDAPQVNGYGYQLKKTVLLSGSSFSLVYEMKNTGKKTIVTNEYVHNFLGFNSRNIDQYYRLRFSFEVKPNGFIETVNPNSNVSFDGHNVAWNSQVESPFFFSRLNQDKLSHCSWTIIHTLEKIGVRETCYSGVNMVNLWGDRHVVSPELFHSIDLLPGLKDTWKREYDFFEL
jgi:hypothetical protein